LISLPYPSHVGDAASADRVVGDLSTALAEPAGTSIEGRAPSCRRIYLSAAGHTWLLALYDPLTRLLGVESVHRRLIELAGIRSGQRVLDIGCGTGNLTILIKRLHVATEVVGLDPDPGALARARRKSDRENLAIQWDRGFAEDLPYPGGTFDHVTSAFMLHHLSLDAKMRALREVERVLASRGSLHVVDFDRGHDSSAGLLARLIHRSERLRDNVGETMMRLMRSAGLADAHEVAHRSTIVGRVAFYQASAAVPSERSDRPTP
jgi:SAM-dependent methyltransferase